MKSSCVLLVVAAGALRGGMAFAPQSRSPPPAGRAPPLHSSVAEDAPPRPAPAPNAYRRRQLDVIRAELVQKYVDLGHDEEFAAGEVDYFLADPERCAQYVEMRREAMAQGDDLGFEDFAQLAGAFLIGTLANWALHSADVAMC